MDTSWIKNYEDLESNYDIFYKENISNIKIYIFYINNKNVLQKIKKDNLLLEDNGILKKEYIFSLIKKYEVDSNNEINNKNKYKLFSLLKYNITLNPENIGNFIDNSQSEEYNYLNPLTTIEDIKYKESISIFQDLNGLYLIFTELPKFNIC